MQQPNFQCSVLVNVPVSEAFEAVQSRIPEWWGKEMTGNSKAPHDIFTVHFGKTSGTCQISELIPFQKIVWDITDCYLDIFNDKTQWKGTSIVWEFSPVGDSTKIQMTHVGLTPDKECYIDCEGGWTFFVTQSLYNLLTKGKGNPGTGIRARITYSGRTYEGTLYAKEDLVPDILPGSIFIDVKERNGEEVLSAYSVSVVNNNIFTPETIRGNYYMIVENQPVSDNILPAEDLTKIIAV
jgi:hypothetical protein